MKNQTKPTSHFLGISLNSKLFSGLFNSIQKYLKENNIESVIELQNINSLHITLYYFGQNLDNVILFRLKNNLLELNKKENLFPIFIDELNFFEKKGQKYLYYLYPSKGKKIEEINSKLKQNYVSEVIDNDYPKYIPHMTLFKIKNFDLYQKHQEKISSIIKMYLKKIRQDNVFKSFNLFSVDSTLSPEKQTIVF